MDHSIFGLCFVNPGAFRSFRQRPAPAGQGHADARSARSERGNASIHKIGHFLTSHVMGKEVGVERRGSFPGKRGIGFDEVTHCEHGSYRRGVLLQARLSDEAKGAENVGEQ